MENKDKIGKAIKRNEAEDKKLPSKVTTWKAKNVPLARIILEELKTAKKQKHS